MKASSRVMGAESREKLRKNLCHGSKMKTHWRWRIIYIHKVLYQKKGQFNVDNKFRIDSPYYITHSTGLHSQKEISGTTGVLVLYISGPKIAGIITASVCIPHAALTCIQQLLAKSWKRSRTWNKYSKQTNGCWFLKVSKWLRCYTWN